MSGCRRPTFEPLLTPDEVCGWLRIGRRHLYRLVERRGIPHVKVGNRLRFERSALRAWLEHRQVEVERGDRREAGRRRAADRPGEPGAGAERGAGVRSRTTGRLVALDQLLDGPACEARLKRP